MAPSASGDVGDDNSPGDRLSMDSLMNSFSAPTSGAATDSLMNPSFLFFFASTVYSSMDSLIDSFLTPSFDAGCSRLPADSLRGGAFSTRSSEAPGRTTGRVGPCLAATSSRSGVWAPFSGVDASRVVAVAVGDLGDVEAGLPGRGDAPGSHSASCMPCLAGTGVHSGL